MPEPIVVDTSSLIALASQTGLKVTGTIGVLLKAERAGLIRSAYDKVKELRDRGFYVAEELLEDISRFKKNT